MDVPVLFQTIQAQSGTSWEEMYKVFNMGHRMEVYTNEDAAKALIDISESLGVKAQIVGRVEAHEGKPAVSVHGPEGIHRYG